MGNSIKMADQYVEHIATMEKPPSKSNIYLETVEAITYHMGTLYIHLVDGSTLSFCGIKTVDGESVFKNNNNKGESQ